LSFLPRLLPAPQRFFLILWRPRVPTFSLKPSRFPELKPLGDRCSSQVKVVSSAPCTPGFWSAAPCGVPPDWSPSKNPYRSPLLKSSPYVLSFYLCIQLCSHEQRGTVRSTKQNPVLGEAVLPLGGRLVSQRVLCETDSPTAIHPIGMALRLQDWGLFFKVYSFRSAVFCATGSPLVGYGSLLRKDGLGGRKAIFSIYHPLRIARALLGPPMSPLGNTTTLVQPGWLPLTPPKSGSNK
jgi:hypothetical protein